MHDNRTAIDDFLQQFLSLLPDDLRRSHDSLEANLRATLSATLARMDLVTREEFDVQTALLARTRALLEELENKVRELEQAAQREPGP